MSRHIQVESGMSLTGSNADNRVLVKPSEQGAAIANLYNEVANLTGAPLLVAPQVNEKAGKALKSVAKELVKSRGHALVVAAPIIRPSKSWSTNSMKCWAATAIPSTLVPYPCKDKESISISGT